MDALTAIKVLVPQAKLVQFPGHSAEEWMVLNGHTPELTKTKPGRFDHHYLCAWVRNFGASFVTRHRIRYQELACAKCGCVVRINHENQTVNVVGGDKDHRCTSPLPKTFQFGIAGMKL